MKDIILKVLFLALCLCFLFTSVYAFLNNDRLEEVKVMGLSQILDKITSHGAIPTNWLKGWTIQKPLDSRTIVPPSGTRILDIDAWIYYLAELLMSSSGFVNFINNFIIMPFNLMMSLTIFAINAFIYVGSFIELLYGF